MPQGSVASSSAAYKKNKKNVPLYDFETFALHDEHCDESQIVKIVHYVLVTTNDMCIVNSKYFLGWPDVCQLHQPPKIYILK